MNLIEGETYYLIKYFDRELRIPFIKTYVYIGKNLHSKINENERRDIWFFQEAENFKIGGSFLNKKKGVKYDVLGLEKRILKCICDLNELNIIINDLIEKGPASYRPKR